jgi:hypothetical protein
VNMVMNHYVNRRRGILLAESELLSASQEDSFLSCTQRSCSCKLVNTKHDTRAICGTQHSHLLAHNLKNESSHELRSH